MTASTPGDYRSDIEGLRGIAILLVVLFHAGVPFVRGAFVAVDVFFVVSGFFLTRALVREVVVNRWIDLTAFYSRRMLRLLPVLLVVLLATLATVMALYAPIDRASIAGDMRHVVFFAGNIAFAARGVNYFSAGENPLLHTWSLGVEQQFHLAWPLLLVLFAWVGSRVAVAHGATDDARRGAARRMLMGIVLAALLSFAVSAWISVQSPMWAYFGPHTRLWEFALGGLVALVAGARGTWGGDRRFIAAAQLVGLSAIGLSAVFFDRSMSWPGVGALVPTAGTMLLLSAGSAARETVTGRALSLPPLQWLGRQSYAWYLWHWPLMVLATVLMPASGVGTRLVLGGVALLLAWATQRCIERPMRYEMFANRPTSTVFIGATVASTLVYLLAQAAMVRAEHVVESSPAQAAFAAARDDHMMHSCWARSVAALPAAPCAFGDVTSDTTIVLLGDSHAEHWLGGLDRAGRDRGWKIVANVMGGCPVADLSRVPATPAQRRYAECNRYREAMIARIVAARPSAVILSSYDHYVPHPAYPRSDFHVDDDVWVAGLRRTYARLADAGIRTVVLRGTPRPGFDVPACLSRKAAGVPFAHACTYRYDRAFIRAAQHSQNVASRGLPMRFVDMNDQVCDTNICNTVKNGVVVFTDDNHLTASFTRSVAPALGNRLAAALSQR